MALHLKFRTSVLVICGVALKCIVLYTCTTTSTTEVMRFSHSMSLSYAFRMILTTNSGNFCCATVTGSWVSWRRTAV
jgi:hypothetical protein